MSCASSPVHQILSGNHQNSQQCLYNHQCEAAISWYVIMTQPRVALYVDSSPKIGLFYPVDSECTLNRNEDKNYKNLQGPSRFHIRWWNIPLPHTLMIAPTPVLCQSVRSLRLQLHKPSF